MQCYLAGGAVRDILLGKPAADRDYLVVGISEAGFQRRFPASRPVGKAFAVYLLDRQEFSFPRARRIEDDLKARDLTVNAMLLDETGELTCHPDSLHDLHHRILRPASPDAMDADPLRVFRAARLWAQMPEFTPHPQLLTAIRRAASDGALASIDAERVGQETRKALTASEPFNFFSLLLQTDCLRPWFDELTPPFGAAIADEMKSALHSVRNDATTAWMTLCHFVGRQGDVKDAQRNSATKLASRIRLPNRFVKAGGLAAAYARQGLGYADLSPKDKATMTFRLKQADLVDPFFAAIASVGGADNRKTALEDLNVMQKVKLQPEEMNLGRRSGIILMERRVQKLEKALKKRRASFDKNHVKG